MVRRAGGAAWWAGFWVGEATTGARRGRRLPDHRCLLGHPRGQRRVYHAVGHPLAETAPAVPRRTMASGCVSGLCKPLCHRLYDGVLHERAFKIQSGSDVFVNVVGGIRVQETAAV